MATIQQYTGIQKYRYKVFVKKIMYSPSLWSYDDILVYNWFATSTINNIYSGSVEAALSFQNKQALRSQTLQGPGVGGGSAGPQLIHMSRLVLISHKFKAMNRMVTFYLTQTLGR